MFTSAMSACFMCITFTSACPSFLMRFILFCSCTNIKIDVKQWSFIHHISVRKPVQLSIYNQCNSVSANTKSSIYVPGNISSNLLPLCLEAFGNSQTDIPILYWNDQSHRTPSHTSLSWMKKKPTHTSYGKEKMRKMSVFHHFPVVGIPVGDNDVCFSLPWVLIVFSEDLSIQLFNLRPLKNIHTHAGVCTQNTTHAALWLCTYTLSAITIWIIFKWTNHKSSEMHKMIIVSCQRGVLIYSRLITGVKQALQLNTITRQ